jgi:hypothetical protein
MTLPSLRPLALVLLVLTCGTALGFAAPAEGKKGKGKGGAPAGSVDSVAAGSPSKAARVTWKGGRGVLGPPRDLGNGVQEWTWTAPAEPGSGEERLTATWKQGSVDSSEEVVVGLTPGAVQRVTFEAFDEVAHQIDRQTSVRKGMPAAVRAELARGTGLGRRGNRL